MENEDDYFWRKPTEYHSYINMRICGYVDMITCLVTITSNTFVVAVLTRKNIISPTNTILTHIAITESLTLLAYLPRSWHEYFRVSKCLIPEHRTYTWEMISYYSYETACMFRQISVLLAVMLAVWRYIAIIHPLKEREWCNMNMTRKIIILAYVIGTVVVIVPYFALNVEPMDRLLDQNGCPITSFTISNNTTTIYEIQFPIEKYPVLYSVAALSYGFFMKLLPSFIIATISYKLIVSLIQMETRRKEMMTSQRKNTYNTRIKHEISERTNRTTKILLVILGFFIMAEVPHGVALCLAAYYGPTFYWKYYYYAMEIFNSLTHISESLNFLLYYSLSSQFRVTFKALFNRINEEVSNSKSTQTSPSSFAGISQSLDNLDLPTSISIIAIGSICDTSQRELANRRGSDFSS